MKNVILFLFLVLFLTGCGPLPTPTAAPPTSPPDTPPPADSPARPTTAAPTNTPTSPTYDWQADVDAIAGLVVGLPVPEHLMQEDAVKQEGDFDAHQFFNVLDHVFVCESCVLDYVYSFDWMGGQPFLYVRTFKDDPYQTYSEYIEAHSDTDWDGYLNSIHTDGTAEGFFQLVVLRVLGGQFYLFWHSNYYDTRLICDQATLERIIEMEHFGELLPNEVKVQARTLDPTPVVEFGENTVTVKVLTFTMWGGFYQTTYTFHQDFPHEILEIDSENLVEYDCGVQF